jgi:uncharacterized protein involved in type VI secretion and phage assembly
MQRNYNLLSPLPADLLRFVSLSGTETVSHLFSLSLTLQSAKGDIAASDLLGKPMTLEIATLPAPKNRAGISATRRPSDPGCGMQP